MPWWEFLELWLSSETRDHLDLAVDVPVEVLEFLRGNPILQMFRAADLLHGVATEILRVDFEFCHISNVWLILGIPVARNLLGIFAVEHRIEDGLFRQSRRKCLVAARGDKVEFLLANWTIQRNGAHSCSW